MKTLYQVPVKEIDFKNMPNDEEFYFVIDLAGGKRAHRCGHIKLHPNNFQFVVIDESQLSPAKPKSMDSNEKPIRVRITKSGNNTWYKRGEEYFPLDESKYYFIVDRTNPEDGILGNMIPKSDCEVLADEKPISGHRQNLFETIQRVTGFTPLQSDMDEIQRACEIATYEKGITFEMLDEIDKKVDKQLAKDFPDENPQGTAEKENILNKLGKEMDITFWDAYVYKKSSLLTPAENLSNSNRLADLILQAMEEYATLKVEEARAKELPSDDDIEKFFSRGYGGDSGSAVFGAKWMRSQFLPKDSDQQKEIERLKKILFKMENTNVGKIQEISKLKMDYCLLDNLKESQSQRIAELEQQIEKLKNK